jgi:hypothetical protein
MKNCCSRLRKRVKMHKRNGQITRQHRGRRWAGVIAGRWSLCGLLLMAGCLGNRQPPPDPLLGNQTPVPNKPANPPPATTPTAFAPAAPAPSSSASTAVLASATGRPLDGGQELRIGTAGTPTAWQGQPTPASLPAASNGSTPPNQPQPVYQPAVRRDPVVARGVAPYGGGRVATFEQAQAILTAHGVKWQRLETWGDRGEWKFSCSIPNPTNAYVSRTYEGRAADSLSAVRAVLDQIDRER